MRFAIAFRRVRRGDFFLFLAFLILTIQRSLFVLKQILAVQNYFFAAVTVRFTAYVGRAERSLMVIS